MLRLTFITAAGPGAVFAPWPGQAQNPAPKRRLGILATGLGSDAANKRLLDATVFRKLQELGWMGGQPSG